MAQSTSKRSKFADRIKALKKEKRKGEAAGAAQGTASREVLEDQVSYWQQQLDGLCRLELPPDRPRTSEPGPPRSSAPGGVSRSVAEGLKALSREEGVPLFTVLLSAFKVLVMRHSDQPDLAVGSPAADRSRSAPEEPTGPLMNMLVVRTSLRGNPSFVELVGRVRQSCDGAFSHQDIPLTKVVESLPPAQQVDRALYQVAFTLQDCSPREAAWEDLEVESPGVMNGWELFARAREQDGRVAWQIYYDPGQYDRTTVERLSTHFGSLLEGIADDPGRRILELPMLSEVERLQEISGSSGRAVEQPPGSWFPARFEAQVDRRPDGLAVRFEEKELTYGELDRCANQLAHHLRGLGVGPEVLVGVHLERSLELVVGLLGILKAGGAFVPLGPELSSEQQAFMIEDARVPVLLTHERMAGALSGGIARQVVYMDRHGDQIAAHSTERLKAEVSGDNLAYVVYSERAPRPPMGIQVRHASFVNFGLSMCDRPGLVESDVMLALTPISSDVSILELLVPLMAGAAVVVASREAAASSHRVAALLRSSEATVMQRPPSCWSSLVDSGWDGASPLKVLCGGEELSVALARALSARGDTVWNMVGQAETTVWSAVQEVAPLEGERPALPIGGAIANTRMYILGRVLELVPAGAEGELCIGGEGVARGFRGHPGATAERFVPDPHAGVRGARLYRTGLLARRAASGGIDVLGQIGRRVKTRDRRTGWERAGQLSHVVGVWRSRGPTGSGSLVARAVDHYNELLINHHGASCIEQHRRSTDLHNLRSGGVPWCNVLRPFMIDRRSYRTAQQLATVVVQAVERASDILLGNADLMRELGFPGYLDAVFDIDRAHCSFSHMTRVDALIDEGGGFKFIENNVSPGSMAPLFELGEMFGKMPIAREFARRFPFSSVPIYDHVIDAWHRHHRKRGGTGTPTIGILIEGKRMNLGGLERWITNLNSRGIHVLMGPAEDFENRRGKLFVGKDAIDFILDYGDSPFDGSSENVRHLYDAVRRNEVACWPSYSRDTVAGYKNVFEFLSNPVYHGHFSKETVKVLREHIPWTRVLRDCKTTHGNDDIDLLSFVDDNRHRFVLKPGGRFGGTDVVLGWRCDADEWTAVMSRAKHSATVVQERVAVEPTEYPVYSSGAIAFRPFYADFAPHVWNSEHAEGVQVRVASGELTNVHAGGGVTDTWILDDD